jgi:hypothetical protein
MSKYFTCFDDYIEDGLPWDWSARWNIASNVYPSAVSYFVHPCASNTQPVKRRAMRMETSTTGAGTPAPGAVSWDAVGSLADFELLSYCAQPFAGGGNDPDSLAVIYRFRCSGVARSEQQGYYIAFYNLRGGARGNTVRFGKTVAGVDVEIASAVTGSGKFYFRILVSGTSIKARAFSDPATEPGTWQLDVTDSTYSAAGWLGWEGFWDTSGFELAAALVQRWCEMNFLSLATPGDTPQVPLTNTQFQAWLARPALRCYIFEGTAVGYSSGGGAQGDFTKTTHTYLSNMGYASQSWDYPPSQPYLPIIKKIPTLKRDVGVALSGKASVGYGALTIDNSANQALDPAVSGVVGQALIGPRENWLRMKWKKNYAKVMLGDPTWPKHDFRPFLIGRLGHPVTGADNSEITFPISDLSDLLTQDSNPTVYTAGDYIGQRMPCLYGEDRSENIGEVVFSKVQIEPPLIDKVTRRYHLSRRSLGRWYTDVVSYGFAEVYDNQVALFHTADRTITATDNTTHTNASHGMLDGWVFVASNYGTGSHGPTPILMYFVVNSTANTFQLAATPGGPAITFPSFNGNTAGNAFRGFGYTIDVDNTGFGAQKYAQYEPVLESFNGAYLQLVSPAVGRVTVANVKCYVPSNSNINQGTIFTRVAVDTGLGYGMLDGPGRIPGASDLTNPTKCIYYGGTQKLSADQAFARLSKGLLCWYGFSPDGFFQFGEMLLPGTAVLSLTQSDVKANSLKLLQVKLPWDLRSAQLWLPWFLSGGAFQTGSQQALQGKVAYPTVPFTGTGVPLDSHPQVADLDQTISQELLFTGQFTYHKTFFSEPIGVFQFSTTMKAFGLKMLDTISLAHPREEWVAFSSPAYPQSPDNTASFNAALARVIGISISPDASDPYPVTVTVFRQLPGYYPVSDVLSNYATSDMLEEDGVTPVLEEDGVTHIVEEGGYSG